MTLISSTIPNFINGVSQQPAAFMLATQAKKQINGVSSVVSGLQKRPPTEHLATLTGLTPSDSNAFVHTLDYGGGEFYTLAITTTQLFVYNSDGVNLSVTNIDDAADYLTGLTNPSQEIASTTIADQTYLINKTKITAKGTETYTTRPYEGLIYVKNGDYRTEYKVDVIVDTTTYTTTYTTRDSSNVIHEDDVMTTGIIDELFTNLSLPTDVNKEKDGNIIRIWSDTLDFKLKATDDRGGTHMFSYKGQTNDFKKLPPTGPLGFTVRVAGNNDKHQDDYWVHLVDPEGNGEPIWKETTAPGIEYKIDPTTMPHVLIKEPQGTFVFQEATWDDRKVGDEETNPFPSFIDQTINDLFFFRNRLGLLSGENVILSEVGSFWNFFHTTTLVLSDAAVIDIAVSTDAVNVLKYAIPFNEALMLFSNTTQFLLGAGQVLAHDTVSVDYHSRYDADLRTKPVGVSDFVVFPFVKGGHGGLREYYTAAGDETSVADNITSHIPKYIKGYVRKISSSSTEDMMVCLGSEDKTKLYVYNYFWQDDEKKQSAWHTWDLGAEILNAEFTSGKLVLMILRGSSYCIETVSFDDSTDTEMEYGHGLLLDRRTRCHTGSLDYDITNSTDEYHHYNQNGSLLGVNWTDQDRQAHRSEYPEDIIFVGIPYKFEYELAEQYARSEGKPLVPQALKLKDINFEFSDTGGFSVVIEPIVGKGSAAHRSAYIKDYRPVIGYLNTRVGRVSIDSGKFKVPIWGASNQLSIALVNDTPYPSTFQNAEWRATFNKFARQI